MKEILDNTAAVERIAVNIEIINDSGYYFILQRLLKPPKNLEKSGESQNLWRLQETLENIDILKSLKYGHNSGECR